MNYNGSFTFSRVDEKTGNRVHRTFEVKTALDHVVGPDGKEKVVVKADQDGQPLRFVALLDGPSNETDFRSFARLTPHGVKVFAKLSKNQNGQDSAYVKYADLLEDWLLDGFFRFGRVYDVQEKRNCRRCNRALTVPSSIDAGLGPICAEKGMFG